jgi:metal-responsive CopG/Arc/MetJ family transcriptional regulator
MKTVQMTLDDELVEEVDRAVAVLGTTRSAFARRALRAELDRIRLAAKEARHRAGYERVPVVEGEFELLDEERAWGDEWRES